MSDEESVCEALRVAVGSEPYAGKLGMRCQSVRPGASRVEMEVTPDMANLFGFAHGGAVFSLIDEAFQLACNSRGLAALALNVSVTYVSAAKVGDLLVAQAEETSLTPRTGSYQIRVTRGGGDLVALAQALAYRKKDPPPFLAR